MTASSYDLTNVVARQQRVKDIRSFMLIGAPIVTLVLYGVSKQFNSKLIIMKKDSLDVDSSTSSKNAFFPFLSKNFKKLPGLVKYFLVYYGTYFSIKYFYPDFLADRC